MRAECQFAKAGQGLFYNGILVSQKGHSFTFVYDCGTSDANSVLSSSVSEYKNLMGKQLDLLAISHFHDDHISHIPRLIEGVELKTVVIPFIRPEVRLLLASNKEGIENDEEMINFYSNPVEYFVMHGAENVISVQYDSDNNFFENEQQGNFVDNDNNPNKIHMMGKLTPLEGKNAKISKCIGAFSIKAIIYNWEFKFINLYYDKIQDDFLIKISELLKAHSNNFSNILRNKTHIKQLRKIYKESFSKGLNETSLIMLSKPINKGQVIKDVYSYMLYNDAECRGCKESKCYQGSTLLTGDISITSELIDRCSMYFHKEHICIPSILQLPHHGAEITHSTLLERLCRKIFYRSCYHFSLVASYGIRNKYGHPKISFYKACHLNKMFMRNVHIELVNERKDFLYTILY